MTLYLFYKPCFGFYCVQFQDPDYSCPLKTNPEDKCCQLLNPEYLYETVDATGFVSPMTDDIRIATGTYSDMFFSLTRNLCLYTS